MAAASANRRGGSANRRGERGEVPIRSDRFFSAQGQWYFSTREGRAVGPFDEKNEALQGLRDFIEFMRLAKPPILSRFYHSLTR